MPLELSKNYNFKLNQPWGTSFTVRITGITNIDDASRYSDFDVKGEFFDPKKLGVATYLTAVTGKKIYVASRITSTDPVTIDKKSILIPESIIDFHTVTDMVACKAFRVTSSNVVRRYGGPIEEREAQDFLIEDLRKHASEVSELVAEAIQFEIDGEREVLYDLPVIEKLDSHRVAQQDKLEQYKVQLARDREQERTQLVADQNAARQAKVDYNNQKNILNAKIQETDALIAEQRVLRDGLTEMRSILIEVMSRIRAGNYIPEQLPSFDDMWRDVVNGL